MNLMHKVRDLAEGNREKFEALASMANADASQIQFGLGISREKNHKWAVLAAQFQAELQRVATVPIAEIGTGAEMQLAEDSNKEGPCMSTCRFNFRSQLLHTYCSVRFDTQNFLVEICVAHCWRTDRPPILAVNLDSFTHVAECSPFVQVTHRSSRG